MSATGKTSFGQKVGKGILYGFLVLLLLFFLVLASGGRSIFIIRIPFHLVCGWWIHAWKALPPFLVQWQAAVLPLGCLLLASVLAHRFILRWAREKSPTLIWRRRHTAAVFSLLILCSGAAIATSGIVHQFFWLVGGKVLYDNRKSEYIVAMRDGRQLMMALLEFQTEKGRYPHSFEELETEAGEYTGMIRRLRWLDSGDREVPESWILLRPGSPEAALSNEPVIISPVIAARGMVVVGYGDFSVRAIRVDKLLEVIGQVGDGKGGDE